MKPEMMAFLQQGMKSYVEARATLALFNQELTRLLSAALEKRADWSPLSGPRIGKASTSGDAVEGYGISSLITGRSPHDEDAEIDCGIWWGSPKGDEPILYASFFDKPKRVKIFDWPTTNERIKNFRAFGRTFLYLPAPETLEFEGPLNLLLDALLPHLGLKHPQEVRAPKG